ncbi:MAG: alpha-2-macroglobulin family protein [Planctomycetes bacterium]|nr:alpha-2-macroglobulin family protein [Planctomycetota bacterium]
MLAALFCRATATSAALSSRWVVVVAILLFSNAATLGGWIWTVKKRAPTRLASFQPKRLGGVHEPLLLAFSRDMVSEGEVGQAADLAALQVTPPAALWGRWRNAKVLELRAPDGFAAATPYQLKFSGPLLDADGYPVQAAASYPFATPALQLQGAYQTELSRDWQLTFRLVFNDAVPGASLERHLHLSDETGAAVPFSRIASADPAREQFFKTDGKRRESLSVGLDAGLVGISGPLGIEKAQTARLQVQTEPLLQEVRPYHPPSFHPGGRGFSEREGGAIALHFSRKVDPLAAKPYIRIEPEMPFQIEGEGSYLRLRGGFKPGARYRVIIKAGMPAEDGRFLADDQVRTINMPELEPGAEFVGEGEFLPREGSQTLLVRSVNASQIFVDVQRIFPNNLVHYLNNARYVGKEILSNRRIAAGAPRNEPATSKIDLRQLLGPNQSGPFAVRVGPEEEGWRWRRKTITITDLAIHAKVARKGMLVWVARLSSGAPAAGVRIAVLTRTNQTLAEGATDERGLVLFNDLTPPAGDLEEPFAVTAVAGEDFSYLAINKSSLSLAGLDLAGRPYPEAAYEAYAYPERGVIRPGESIHLRALVRELDGRLPPREMPLLWEFTRPDRRPAGLLPAAVSEFGAVETLWKAESFYPTGLYTAALRIPGDGGRELGRTSFRVEDFLPVTLRPAVEAEDRRFGGGEELRVQVRAEHLFGGSAAGLSAKATCRLIPAEFTCDAWPGVAFTSSSGKFLGTVLEAKPIELDAEGKGALIFQLPREVEARSALQALAAVEVFEVSGRACTARLARAVDPLPFYLGVRRPEGGARLGKDWKAECIALKPGGSPENLAAVEARLARLTWEHDLKLAGGVYRWSSDRKETEILSRTVPLENGRGLFSFLPEVGGHYRLSFRAPRGEGQLAVETSLEFYVEGGAEENPSLEIPSRIALSLDKKYYRAGEKAHVRVESPIAGTALLTLETDHIHEARLVELASGAADLEVPVSADLVPHGYLTLTVLQGRAAPRSRGVPLRAYGAVALLRDPAEREAKLALTAPVEARPGDELRVEIAALRADGCPEEGEAAVALVDAGILALTAFPTPDPLAWFTAQRELSSRPSDVYSEIVLEPCELLATAPSRPGGDKEAPGAGDYLNPIASKRVETVALWAGGLKTGLDGKAVLTIKAPEFDGELVALAVLSGRSAVGSARAAIKVHRPVVVQPSLPRFLAAGDAFQVPVSVHNTTKELVEASLSIRLDNRIFLATGEPGEQLLRIGGGGQATAWFHLAARETGNAEVIVRCQVNGESFEKRAELPVRPAAPPVPLSQNAMVEGGKTAELALGADFLPGTASSELVLSTSFLPNVEGSLQYLLDYPYGCVEQTSSKLVPWIALRDYLRAISSDAYTDEEIRDHVRAGVERLFSMQTEEGGLGWWPGDTRPYPWGSVHAAQILLEARGAGHEVPEKRLERLLDYLDGLLADSAEETRWDSNTLRAYSAAILARASRMRRDWIRGLWERREELSAEARAQVVLAAALARVNLNAAEAPPAIAPAVAQADAGKAVLASFQGLNLDEDRRGGRRELSGTLYSRTRELSALVSAFADLGAPPAELFPLLIPLLRLQEKGRYRSTQEDAFALLALAKAARAMPPPLGETLVKIECAGKSIEQRVGRDRVAIPLPADEKSVSIAVLGGGPAYAVWKARGVPLEGVPAEDRGIQVRRAFLRRDFKARPEGPFRRGETVLIRIELDCPSSLPNVVVVDALPAGFEIENPELATASGEVKKEGGLGLRHSDMRDDRLILFADPSSGKSSYTYVVRAVTPGLYTLPPIAAECMYDASIHSVHGGGKVEVVR